GGIGDHTARSHDRRRLSNQAALRVDGMNGKELRHGSARKSTPAPSRFGTGDDTMRLQKGCASINTRAATVEKSYSSRARLCAVVRAIGEKCANSIGCTVHARTGAFVAVRYTADRVRGLRALA